MIRLTDVLVVTEADAPILGHCVSLARRARRTNGLPPSPALDRLAAALADLGHADSSNDPARHDEAMTTQMLDTATAAQALGVSERTARRLAPALGGRKTGGVWFFDPVAVHEFCA